MTRTPAFATLFSPIDIHGKRFRNRTAVAPKLSRIQGADWRVCEICCAWRGKNSLSKNPFSTRPTT